MSDLRILLDQDIPYDLASALADRGYRAVHAADLPLADPTDAAVYAESARLPGVLVTCEVRAHADRAFGEMIAIRHRLAVAMVLVPGTDRLAAIRDAVHRWAHRLPALHADAPAVATLSRTHFRARTLGIAGRVPPTRLIGGGGPPTRLAP